MAGKTYKTTDAEVIKRWAAARNGTPAIMTTHEQNVTTAAVPCIVFPTDAYPDAYTTISWQEIFDRMQQDMLVFVYQEKTASGDPSRFSRFISQEAAEEAAEAPGTRLEQHTEAPGLYHSDDLDTPQAQGIRAFRHPERFTRRSRRLLVALAMGIVLILVLILGVFWPNL